MRLLGYPGSPRPTRLKIINHKVYRWMLHMVVVEERPPHMILKWFGCTAIHNKALYKYYIYSFIDNDVSMLQPCECRPVEEWGGGTVVLGLCSRQPCLVWVHPYSLWISTVLGEWGGLLSSPDNLLYYSKVWFGSWAEPGRYRSAEDRFNDCRVEMYQQLLWQVELPQLAKANWVFWK